jgi:hypothetical protein
MADVGCGETAGGVSAVLEAAREEPVADRDDVGVDARDCDQPVLSVKLEVLEPADAGAAVVEPDRDAVLPVAVFEAGERPRIDSEARAPLFAARARRDRRGRRGRCGRSRLALLLPIRRWNRRTRK